MSLFRRSRQSQPAAEPSKPTEDPRPSPARLYSDYVNARPTRSRPIDSAERAMSRAMFIDPLPESIRHKMVILIEQRQPTVPIPGSRFNSPAQGMANIAIERMVAVRGDLSLRSHRPHPQMLPRPFEDLTTYVIEGDCPLALDAIGAWADTYARLPGLQWLRDEEAQFLSGLDEILSDTIFAVRGREVILREDLGASVLVDKPLAALITSDPALRGVDDKLREALAELDAGKAADAVTDAGTALQMLLEHLGYSGGQLGDQLKAARKAGWLTGTDTPLADAVDSLGRWIASIRNQHGDAHHGPEPDRRDAELAVRVVGLLVLRFGK